uniref:Uncharacterized protein LOC105043703 n=1 Tax=Elaeis guineensis var. tenera TaxID=51953 RepID=A0A6I9R4W4_ELAGV|nr:uncharacterized protein LOC105043703 [Elaeis guineensis]
MEGEGGGGEGWWWWAAASSAQLTAGIAWYRRGCGKSGAMMPFKAFAIATVFVSGGATAAAGALHATGIRTVDDMKKVGSGIRRWMGAPPNGTK